MSLRIDWPTDPTRAGLLVPLDLDEFDHAGGGTVTFLAYDSAGRWIGWVGDERLWRGHRYGARRWWSCWRQLGDTAARWNSHPAGTTGLSSRKAAREALLAVVADRTADDAARERALLEIHSARTEMENAS